MMTAAGENRRNTTRKEAEKIYFDSVSMAFAGDDVKEKLLRKGRDFFERQGGSEETGV